MQFEEDGNLVSGLPGRASALVEVLAAAACLPPPTTTTMPQAGQVVYRVWGGDAIEFSTSWTPIDPRSLGSDEFRKKAGLPDRLNAGTMLTFGLLDDTASIVLIRFSRPVNTNDDYGLPAYSTSGVAYRAYPGGTVLEYLIPNAALHILSPQRSSLIPSYGGPPVGCTPAPRGCVGE